MDLQQEQSVWDYNCPQYVDFCQPLATDDGADKWFELDHEDFEEESTIKIDSSTQQEVEKPKTPRSKQATPKARVTPMRREGSTGPVTRQQAKMTPAGDSVPSNLFTSLEEWRTKKPVSKDSGKKVGVVAPQQKGKGPMSTGSDASPVLATESRNPALKRQKTSQSNLRKAVSKEDVTDPKSRSLKRSNSSVDSRNIERGAQSHTRGYSAGRSGSIDRQKTDGPCAKVPRHTVKPTTPSFMRRKQLAGGSPRVKTTEEQELEQIAQMRQELAKKRKMAMDSLKKSKTGKGYAPVQSAKQPTCPLDIKFRTDSRVKSQHEDIQDETCTDFTRSLRSQTTANTEAPRMTIPQPFKLSVSHKVPIQSEKYQSMAQSVAAFHKATPDRFRRKPRRTGSDRRLLKSRSPHLTHPKTPNLETRTRYRPVKVPSQKEIEEQEYEEIKRHQFKAHPVNSKIMSQTTGLIKPDPKPTTQVEEFHLHLDSRVKERQANRKDDKEEYVFHAQPVNKKILDGPVGVKPPKEISVTIPQSPAFALKNRVRLPVELPEEKEIENIPKANPVPHQGLPFVPKRTSKRTTPEPFSFENRYRDPNAVKETLRKQVLEEEQRAREFRANPLPSLDPVLPERNTKLCTKTEPFILRSDIRGEKKSEEWSHKLEEEMAKQKKAAMFKARPAEVLKQEPFVPEKSTRPLTDSTIQFVLNTERRSEDRDEYELRKKAREAQLAEICHEREVQKMEEEKAAIAKLRSEMVHKPNPIRKFKPVVIHGSEKSPTLPESPHFSDRLRRKVRL